MNVFSSLAGIDQLADAWRWWTVPGAIAGIILLSRRMFAFADGFSEEFNPLVEGTILDPIRRASTTAFALLMMFAALVGGLIIPLASDGRMVDFVTDSLLFRQMMAFVWLLWGTGCWGIAITLAPRMWSMVAACVVLFWAAFVGVYATVGAMM